MIIISTLVFERHDSLLIRLSLSAYNHENSSGNEANINMWHSFWPPPKSRFSYTTSVDYDRYLPRRHLLIVLVHQSTHHLFISWLFEART